MKNESPVGRSAASLWQSRLDSELQSSQRFVTLATKLRGFGASPTVVEMALRAGEDELRHADACRDLVLRFGGRPRREPVKELPDVASAGMEPRAAVLYEVIALSCVTETLSVALLGELVATARDAHCERVMRSILRDEVRHSRLGWACLAEEHGQGLQDCVGHHLPRMLDATLGPRFFEAPPDLDPTLVELEGLGRLATTTRQRVVRETLLHVVFAGLDRFGVDTTPGRRYVDSARG